jgi:hypothetical protein
MCIGSSCHKTLSLLVTTTTTNNTIAIIDKILFGLLMLILLTPWDITPLTIKATLFDLL